MSESSPSARARAAAAAAASAAVADADGRRLREEETILRGSPGDRELADDVLRPLFTPSKWWVVLFGTTGVGVLLLLAMVFFTVVEGVGLWGNNIPVAWAFAIINFVWWIGLGHAGTFISAFLLLLEQGWRGSINRIAEAMTLFAILMAGLFPLLHLGRPWFFYWLVPYPSRMGVWPQFRSTLPWDVAAIFTYLTVSVLFWYLGLVPDLATARDRAPSVARRRMYGVFALGWRGSARDWGRHRVAYGLMAGLATPLVVSVHSIVSLDFAIAQVPGWHSTFFPPYFVVGAIYSGFALVLMLVIPVRRIFGFQHVITGKHLDAMAKILLVTGWIMLYSYVVEHFLAWYSGSAFDRYQLNDFRPFGTYRYAWWATMAFNCLTPQLFWFRRFRRSPLVLWLGSALIFTGMWMERFVIIVASLSRDFLVSSWRDYAPTWVDWGILAGTLGTFAFLMLLFLRFVPTIPIHEVKEIRHEMREEGAA